MRIYHSVNEVLSDRRKGIGLNEVIDSLLQSPRIWEEYLTPFSLIQSLQKGDYVDMSTLMWRSLPVETQMILARGYQWWYANQCGLSDIHRTFEDGVEIEMVLIPPMRYFIYFSSNVVSVKEPFWMSEHETTQEQWLAVMGGENPSHFQGNMNLPVERVSWNDCQKFCVKVKGELPTEAQWELACRAGTTTEYSFGNDLKLLEDYCWYWNNAKEQTHTVKQKLANAFDLYDMHGNVWEWCESNYDSSSYERVFRGGSWISGAWFCSSGNRTRREPSHRYYDLGFRVMRPFQS